MFNTQTNSQPNEIIYKQRPVSALNPPQAPSQDADPEDSWSQGTEDGTPTRTTDEQGSAQKNHELIGTLPRPSWSDDESKDDRPEDDDSIIVSAPSHEESDTIYFSSEESSTSSSSSEEPPASSSGTSNRFAMLATRAMSNPINRNIPAAPQRHRHCPQCSTTLGAIFTIYCAVSGVFYLVIGSQIAVTTSQISADHADSSVRKVIAENAALAGSIILAGTISVGCAIFYLKTKLEDYFH